MLAEEGYCPRKGSACSVQPAESLPEDVQSLPGFQASKENEMIAVNWTAYWHYLAGPVRQGIRREQCARRHMDVILTHPLLHVATRTEQKITVLHTVGFCPDQLGRLERVGTELLHALIDPLGA